MTLTAEQKLIDAKHERAYLRGVADFRNGIADINPYCKTDLLERSAWSGGYFDAKRGYV